MGEIHKLIQKMPAVELRSDEKEKPTKTMSRLVVLCLVFLSVAKAIDLASPTRFIPIGTSGADVGTSVAVGSDGRANSLIC